MLCEKILGNLLEGTDADGEGQFSGLRVDYVDIEWHEAFSRLHRKVSSEGEDVGIRLGDSVLSTGLKQGDVLYADGEKAIAVNIPPCEAIRAVVRKDHFSQVAKLCYEVGNTHTSMFRGEDDFTFYTPYHAPLLEKISQIHGVEAEKVMVRFDFQKALSSSVNNHHH